MATQVNTSLPMWLAGCTYDANGGNDLRNSGVGAYFYDQGIVTGSTIGILGGVVGGSGLDVSAGTGMTVLVQPGHYVVPNSGTPTAGGYASTLTSQATLTVQTADPTNSRIDIVVAFVSDVGTSASFGAVEIITGVAAPSPSAPAAPANSITLAKLTVPAGVTAITSGMLSDIRPFTTTTGGVLVAPKGSVTGYRGQIGYDVASGSFYHNNNISNATQLHVLPWEPVVAKITSTVTVTNDEAEHSVISTTVVTDGFTDIEVFFKVPGISSVATHGSTWIRSQFRMYVDNSVVDTMCSAEVAADTWNQAGVAWSYYTSSATGDTPSAGTHTVKVTVQNTMSNIGYQLLAANGNSIILRVEPVAM
jgi:hypothetical protein